ncbi:hybrid sensor histidine kinase/response regulator [uncultured Roseobacter sp.]|uniref:hybrid sensor histidine kinase/response regulator n=1 Tax=uncultured Roseobacter sp. TaxID=114847 RepID=UPI002601CD9C|nr:hybrid sensor histidine kinase/response regulator [uncultured Roseobacter sp.]
MKIRNKLLLAITVPVGLLLLQIALVTYFVRELQVAVTFIAETHETIEGAFTAGDLVVELRDQAKRLPSGFVSEKALGEEELGEMRATFDELTLRIQSISSGTPRQAAQESFGALEHAFAGLPQELALTERVLSSEKVDMDTLLERAIFLDAALVDVAAALDDLSRELRVQLQAAVDREREIHNRPVVAGVAIGGLSVLMLLLFTWLVVDRNFVMRLTSLSRAMLSIAAGDLRTSLPEAKGGDEVDEMTRTVETFRVTAQERDKLLEERAEAAERLEKQVAERTAELETANQFKTRFLTTASHDLRQPLHALNLLIDQLRDARKPDERRHLEEKISEAAASTNELFDALLDMSKLEAGVVKADVSSFPISSILDRLEANFTTVAMNKGVRFRVVGSDLWVESDAILLERILLNLVSNAVRATNEGGIIIGCRRRGKTVRIDVYDTGPGIPTEMQHPLFAEFAQSASIHQNASEGLGLGLSIVDGFAKLLDHNIELASTQGRGTRFSVHVPIIDAGKIASAPSAPFEPLAGQCVLVIENDALARESMAGIFGAWGCEVLLAEGVADCVKVVSSGPTPDLIVSDYRLENGQTGLDAIVEVHRIANRTVPALLVTAETAATRLRDAAQSGYPILHKPVTPMALRALSSQLIKNG